jgi:hypothetical protein
VLAGTEERIPGFRAEMAVKATGGAAPCFVTPHAAAMIRGFQAEEITMVALAIFCCRLEMVGGEWFCRMAVSTGDALTAAPAVVTAHAIRILCRSTGGVMMTLTTIANHFDMIGVIKQNWLKVFAELVNPHLCRRRGLGRKGCKTGNENEGCDDDRNDHFDSHE